MSRTFVQDQMPSTMCVYMPMARLTTIDKPTTVVSATVLAPLAEPALLLPSLPDKLEPELLLPDEIVPLAASCWTT